MAYKSGTCWCCEDANVPVQGHHIIPVEYGGPMDGKKVNICGKCHTQLHYEAEAYYKTGQYLSPIESLSYFNRLEKLIKKVVEAKSTFEDSGQPDNDQRRMTQISWASSEELAIAHAVKRAMKFTSLERTIKACVFEFAKALQKKGRLQPKSEGNQGVGAMDCGAVV